MWTTEPLKHILLKVSLSWTLSEDSEALIKMIIKPRSPTMGHVSRTNRVALDWLFDRIHLEPNIQIKYVDTKNPTRGHSDQREFFHVTNGIIFFVCSTSWVSRCSLVAISVIFFLTIRLERHVKKRSRGNLKWRFSDGKAETNNSGTGETTQLGGTQPEESEKLYTEFGVSGQSGQCRWTKRSGNSFWKQWASCFKVRRWIFSSELTRECFSRVRKLVAWGTTSKTTWWESIF